MKLRTILMILSLLAFLSASTGGYLYYSSLKESALKEAERQAVARVQMIKKNISSFLSENIKPVSTLAGIKEVSRLFVRADADSRKRANAIIDHFRASLDADVCYLMDPKGNTVASSNRDAPDSFVGKNFSFRPYFKQAIKGMPATYLALGITSRKRGAYYSHPVYDKIRKAPVGIAVIKASIELIEKELVTGSDEIVLVIDPQSVVFISNRKEWLYHSLKKLSSDEIYQIARSQQFGMGPWDWTGIKAKDEKYATDTNGDEYLMHQMALDNYPGWQIIHLRNLKAISKTVLDPLIRITGPLILTLCVLIGLAVFFLYRKASLEILKRQSVELALRESEERYRSLYHNTPAMLHSIDSNGCLISVSDYWVEVLGYAREEVVGRKLTDFFTESSRRHAEETVLPQFFKTGYCKDIPYRFVKKNGDIIDILLSAISEQDAKGKPIRSLAICVDVTERNRAEKALKIAKEKLSHYSKDLERQVRKQTKEITSILEYTPAVVYIKDKDGKYVLVNSRFEELFSFKNEEVRGKTDYDIFPQETADQFRNNDLQVLSKKLSYQVEEQVPINDGIHTYLSVKFPIYDEAGAASGVCGISTDITAVKKAQEQLRRLSVSVMDSQEKERTAVARELHDELGQLLTALQMDLVSLQNRLSNKDPKVAERVVTMSKLIDETIEEVRSMAIRLRPGVLDTLGLVDALEWYTTDFEKRTGTTCVFEHCDVPSIKDTLATAAYRIAQEALTNVTRHAAAKQVNVNLRAENGVLSLSVVDDGRGFNIAVLSENEALGVAGMRERATLVGGELEVRSQMNKGTEVHFRVPIGSHVKEVN
jgi:PAS domain S-box-containing protein